LWHGMPKWYQHHFNPRANLSILEHYALRMLKSLVQIIFTSDLFVLKPFNKYP
jgi:hypothetical protein